MSTVLRVENLNLSYNVGRRWLPAVRDFRITIQAGQIYGVVGESGSGKSTVAAGIIRYLPANGRTEPGSVIEFMGENMALKSPREMRRFWGAHMNLVPQNPSAALNPSLVVGEQVAEILRQHRNISRRETRERVIEMFRRVHLPDPERLLARYPHVLSGGMQQRVVIAMALITSPQLLILDEPTTSLDVTTEAVILDLVRALIHEEQSAALYVTHNLGVVAQICDRVTVMYAGEIMEDAAVNDLFAQPLHPYTIGLLHSIPRLGDTKYHAAMQGIAGHPPSLAELPPGCVYAPRCPLAIAICHTKPPLEEPATGRLVRCHRWQEIAQASLPTFPSKLGEGDLHDIRTRLSLDHPLERASGAAVRAPDRENLLKVHHLTKHFPVRRRFGETLRRENPALIRAVDGINLSIQKGRTLGLVGESGSGKTTLARLIIGLEDRTAGTIELMGVDIPGNVHRRGKQILAQLQMVFQNPQNSLNPYLTVGQAIRRPLLKLAGLSRAEADREVLRLLDAVNLRPEFARRYPGELSGGEKQRVAIARAFASDPALIICDEPVSSLDVSVQAVVLNLLARLQTERDTSYLFISHDLAVVGYLADYLAVMYLGQLYEVGYGSDLFAPPYHPYTEALVASIPVPDPQHRARPVRLSGDVPNLRDLPTGCRFHPRCPRKLGAICEQEVPPWRDDGDGHFIRCHRELDDLIRLQTAQEE